VTSRRFSPPTHLAEQISICFLVISWTPRYMMHSDLFIVIFLIKKFMIVITEVCHWTASVQKISHLYNPYSKAHFNVLPSVCRCLFLRFLQLKCNAPPPVPHISLYIPCISSPSIYCALKSTVVMFIIPLLHLSHAKMYLHNTTLNCAIAFMRLVRLNVRSWISLCHQSARFPGNTTGWQVIYGSRTYSLYSPLLS